MNLEEFREPFEHSLASEFYPESLPTLGSSIGNGESWVRLLVRDVVALGRAHGRALSACAFGAGLAALSDGAERDRLAKLFEYWALARAEEGAAWSAARGLLDVDEACRIEARKTDLLGEMESDLDALVADLRVPSSDLSGALASEDYIAWHAGMPAGESTR